MCMTRVTATPAIQRGGPVRSGGLRSCIIDLFAWTETQRNPLLSYALLIRLGWVSVNRDNRGHMGEAYCMPTFVEESLNGFAQHLEAEDIKSAPLRTTDARCERICAASV